MKKNKEHHPFKNNISRRNAIKGGAAMVGAGVLGSMYTTAKAAVNTGLDKTINSSPAIITANKSDLIRTENAKEGTTDWIITKVKRGKHEQFGDGWDVREEIQGYVSHMSIKAGETLRVYVSTKPADDYKLDIYRMGYYGGKGGRLVKSISPLRGTPQPFPEDGEHGIQECQWDEAVSFEVPENWLSGVYLGKLSTWNTDAEAYVIFVVRDDREADLMFQVSDFTWQSYNRWPKFRSMYDHPVEGAWRSRRPESYSAGFDRPYAIFWNGIPAGFEPISNGSGEFLLWELPLAYWLEKEGYDVTYISNLDAHEDVNRLLRGKVFLSVGHDEYWTKQLYDNVLAARDAGVNLAFLSGNSVSGRIELLTSSDGRPHRGIRSVPGGLDAIEIMGARSYGVGFADWPCVLPDHWAFEGTGMKNGDFVRQLVGWEYHGYPVAEQHEDLVVLAEGPVHNHQGNVGERTFATTLYTANKGNLVFNASTCWWNMVLSTPPAYPIPPFFHERGVNRYDDDERVQRITKNILDRMISINIT